MSTNIMTTKPFNAAALPCAQIQGAPSRLRHGATVVLLAPVSTQIQGGAVGDVKYGGQGSRAWSPPV